jgi:hypothetical protein
LKLDLQILENIELPVAQALMWIFGFGMYTDREAMSRETIE